MDQQASDRQESGPPQRRPALFMHIQKTAGTALMQVMAAHYGEGNYISHDDYLTKSPADIARLPFVAGHFGHAYAAPLLPGRYGFVFLRDPVERLLSFYSFCLTHYSSQNEDFFRLARSVPFDRFLEMAADSPNDFSQVWNNQTWMLAHGWGVAGCFDDFSEEDLVRLAIRHLDDFAYVGFTETFHDDVLNILHDLGIRNPPPPERHNSSPHRLSVDMLPTATRRLADRLTALDRHVYEHAWSAYLRRGGARREASSPST